MYTVTDYILLYNCATHSKSLATTRTHRFRTCFRCKVWRMRSWSRCSLPCRLHRSSMGWAYRSRYLPKQISESWDIVIDVKSDRHILHVRFVWNQNIHKKRAMVVTYRCHREFPSSRLDKHMWNRWRSPDTWTHWRSCYPHSSPGCLQHRKRNTLQTSNRHSFVTVSLSFIKDL